MSNGDETEARDATLIRSVDRAVAILDLLAREGWSAGAEVARELGVHRSTALRLLATLDRHGLVERDARTSKYRLGRRLVQLASSVRGEVDLRQVARPVCEALARSLGETVSLGHGHPRVRPGRRAGAAAAPAARTPHAADHRRQSRAGGAARAGPRGGVRAHVRGARGRPERDCGTGAQLGRRGHRRGRRERARPPHRPLVAGGPHQPHRGGGSRPVAPARISGSTPSLNQRLTNLSPTVSPSFLASALGSEHHSPAASGARATPSRAKPFNYWGEKNS